MTKYDPDNDSNYPKVGDKIDDNRKVKKATHIETNDLMRLLTSTELPADSENLIIVDCPTISNIKYLVWWEKSNV
jgi:hypothetical protein